MGLSGWFFLEAESSNYKARCGPGKPARLALRQSVPARWRERIIGNLLDLTRDQSRASPVSTEARGFLAVRIPDVEGCTQHIAARVADQIAAEVFVAEEDFDVAGQWEDAWIRGDDSVARLTSAPRLALHAVLGERDRNRNPILGASELGRNERNDALLHLDRFVRSRAQHPGCIGNHIDSFGDWSGQRRRRRGDTRRGRGKRSCDFHDGLLRGCGEVTGVLVSAFDG